MNTEEDRAGTATVAGNDSGRAEDAAPATEAASAGSGPADTAAPAPWSLKSYLREIVQPFIDLVHAPRALWGVNLSYFLEGLVYFGILGYLGLYFSDYVFRGTANPNELAHDNVMVLTAGITLSMLFLGNVADKKGVRPALIAAFVFMLVGRIVMSAAPTVLGLRPAGLWSPLHLVTVAGILLVVVGYGMYMPAAYAAVKQFTTPKTAAMGYAMLYAVMNLGGWFPTFAFLLRDDNFLGLGIPGTFWVYTALTAVALVATIAILTRPTVEQAIATARAEAGDAKATDAASKSRPAASTAASAAETGGVPLHLWIFVGLMTAAIYFGLSAPWSYVVAAVGVGLWLVALTTGGSRRWLARHPLADGKFFFFIFALIPVQTLFTYNWLVLPQYIHRAFAGWIGEYFEFFSNLNPILIFVLTPVIAAMTMKRSVYKMMIAGTFVMAAPAFLLVLGPYPWTLTAYIVLMTVGEAMWQPRFLQYAAEIAPEGRTGEYMGVAQLPWFLTKVLVPFLYSGWMMDRYCPAEGPKNTQLMWLIYAFIAIASTVMLVVAKPWLGKDFKTKAA